MLDRFNTHTPGAGGTVRTLTHIEARQLTEDRGDGDLRSVAAVPEGISGVCCLTLLRGRCT